MPRTDSIAVDSIPSFQAEPERAYSMSSSLSSDDSTSTYTRTQTMAVKSALLIPLHFGLYCSML